MEKLLFALLIGLLSIKLSAQHYSKESSFSFGASYYGDVVSNTMGGIEKGTQYLGMGTISVLFDTEKANLWKGGELHVLGVHTHGDEPTANMIGDFQTVSNIEAGNLSYFQELWYKQTFENFQVTIGISDLNAYFVATDNGANFINSSFGIPSIFADNIVSPIFPNTAFGMSLHWNISESITAQAAIYDGNKTDFEQDASNLKQSFNVQSGYQSYGELQFNYKLSNTLLGTAKIGTFYHNKKHVELDFKEMQTDSYGFYLIYDQQLFAEANEKQGLNLFAQVSTSPSDRNFNAAYWGLGFCYTGLFPKRDNDILSLGTTNAYFINYYCKAETVIELNYHLQLGNCCFVKPDFQYIINPAGTDVKLENAMVALLRVGVEF